MVPSLRNAPARRWLILPVLLSVTALAFSSASACSKGPTITEAPDSGTPIEIGVSIALTGDLGASGVPIQNAVRVAEQQINANGGVLGRRVVFKIVDDATDTSAGVSGVVNAMMNEGAVAILGPRGSSQVVAVQDQIAKRQIIEISGSATSPSLTDAQPPVNRFLFRTIPPDTLQGKAVAILAISGPPDRVLGDAGVFDSGNNDGGDAGDAAPPPPVTNGCTKMAIVHSDDSYGNP
ncbi:MAG: ABC transporter substrate-binding protein, partial [Polyangiaceae bacterium]